MGNQLQSILERSDDDGQTWQRADHGLKTLQPFPFEQPPWFAHPLDATGDSLVTSDTSTSGGSGAPADFWVTHDAGAHWRRVTSDPLPDLPVGQADGALMTEPALADASRACHCFFLVNPYNVLNQRLYFSRDLAHWTPLPPIPVKGVGTRFSGVYQVLGLTSEGRLLALGPDPGDDLSALIGGIGPFTNTPPALWLWDTHAGRWEVAPRRLPCVNPQNCYDPRTFLSASPSAPERLVSRRGRGSGLAREGPGQRTSSASSSRRLKGA
jgi:hypothetical protein